MNTSTPISATARDIRAGLTAMRPELSKGTLRAAEFILTNPGVVAILSSAEVAKRCDVHASSLVRLAQRLGLSGFRELQAILQTELTAATPAPNAGPDLPPTAFKDQLRLRLLGESGQSFNQAANEATDRYWSAHPEVEFHAELHVSHAITAEEMAHSIEIAAKDSDGILLVAREHPAINRAVQDAMAGGVPVVCLTTDLPSSGRTAYIGSDQYASGSTAGWFCGRLLPRGQVGRVLLVCSVPFRCQLDREQGFRQVLRSDFPMLSIDEKVSSDESVDVTYEAIRRHITKSGPPAAIYNVSGANLGIGRALQDEGLAGRTVFIGHELNANSRMLLEKGIMDIAISHDFDREIALAVDCIRMARDRVQALSRITPSLLYTRHNCATP